MSLSSRAALYDPGPRLLRDIWTLTGIAIVIVALRVAAKIKIRKFGWDDILMVSALCLSIVGSALITVGIKYGFGRHAWDLDTTTVVPKVIMFDYLTQTFGIAGGTLGRISFIVFIIGLLGTKRSHRVILWIIVGLQTLTNSILIIILFVQCPGHASAIWNQNGKDKCWDVRIQAYYGYYQGSLNSATDLYLAVFSTYIFWNLNLKLRVKLGLVVLLGLGIFAMAASVMKAVQTQVLAHADNDPTVATVNYDRWLYIEAYLVIITASIPCIRSLLRSVRRRTIETGQSAYELSSPYAGNAISTSRSRRLTPTITGKSMIRISDNSSADEKTAGDVAGKTFDYIIVGGGTAGCLIAHHLSATPNASVLVLDKGRVNAGVLSRIPLLGILQSGVVRYHAEPNAHLRGRHVQLLAGEMLGGTSRAHSMVWSPGGQPEFDGWARELGLDEWRWEKVAPAFARVEKAIPRKGAGDLGLMSYVDAAIERVGLDDGGGKRGTQRYTRSEVSVDADGNRVSALTAWLNASVVNERKGRLTVCTGVTATKLEFEDDGTRVTGVWIKSEGGADILVKAQQEVIICSGVFGTPRLLMQSGIGPKDHLSAHKIPVMHDLPAVGANLTTHILVPVMTELPLKHTLHIIQTVAILWHFLLWLFSGTGVLASNGQWGAAFLDSDTINDATMTVIPPEDDEKEVTDLEILIAPLSTLIEYGVPGVPCMTWYAALVQPHTTGSVELSSSSDAKSPLKITLPLLTDARDSARLRKAVRFAMRLADEFAGPEVGYPQPAPLTMAPGMGLEYLDGLMDKNKSKSEKRKLTRALPPQKDAWKTVTDTDIDEYIKRLVTGSYDPAGTCRMSLKKEEGVVDQSLKVYGVRNLRIADASVLPRCGGASISASIYMIGERCAEFVMREDGFPS